jgi:molybdopterin converting factor small subunit
MANFALRPSKIKLVLSLLEITMKLAIVPHLENLMVIVDSPDKVNPESSSSAISTMYAPWPDAQEKGFAEIDVGGDTLRELLVEIGSSYKKVNVDFEPICPITNDLKLDYDVFVNGKNFILLAQGLETRLSNGDEVKILADTIGHC